MVLDDADLPLAVECAVNGAFFGTGQKCTASSRLIVTEGIHDRYVQALVERIGQLKVGHPLREGVHIGPVIDEGQLARNLRYIELARAEGARLACGGERIEDERPGYYMRPALFVDTRNDMRINRDEVFGPIACVIKARDYEDALTLLNDTRFGLTAGIVTRSLRHASDFAARPHRLRHGQPAHRRHRLSRAVRRRGDSSFGPREQGQYARDLYGGQDRLHPS